MMSRLRDPREVPYQGAEMRSFNRVHLHRSDQPCWGDGVRVLKVIPPQRRCPEGRAFLFEPGCHDGYGESPFVYEYCFLPEELA
jgi:hypothetical protein